MQVDILNIEGAKTGRTIELPEEIFGAEPNNHVIYLAVKQYLAAQRQGTHKVKTRAEVQGASRKLHRQKGTGGSRKGSIKSPLFPGGGRVFGPKPRDYSFKLNIKVKDLARKSALTYKAKENSISVIEDFQLEDHKTKNFHQILKSLGVESKKILLVVNEANDNLRTASRNMKKSRVARVADLNTYDIVNADALVLTEGAAKIFVDETEVAEEKA